MSTDHDPGHRGTPRAKPFHIAVSDQALEDLAARLRLARLASGLPDDGWSYGTSASYLDELVRYWRDRFDWRAQEQYLNTFDHYTTTIDEVPIHFVRAEGRGPRPVPLLLIHGWPSSFYEFLKVVGPLSDPATYGSDPTDAFEVIVPSLPGYGFSSPLDQRDISFVATADIFATLMSDVLEHDRFVVHGGDWGTLVGSQLGHKYSDRVAAIHLSRPVRLDAFRVAEDYHPWNDMIRGSEASTDGSATQQYLAWERLRAAHHAVHMGDPQTLAHAMHDSPVGLASWLIRRWHAWSDCHGDLGTRFTRDELLTTVCLYWFTDTFWSSVRYYAAAVDTPWAPSHDRIPVVEVPTGLSIRRPDQPPGLDVEKLDLSSMYNIVFSRVHERGGHFASMEEPAQVVADLREFFRPLRTWS